MRGQGRVYRTHADRAVWMCDYTVKEGAGKSHRYRESTGKTNKQEALDEVQRRIKLRRQGKPVEPPKPPTLGGFAKEYLKVKPLEVDQETGRALTPRWLDNIERHVTRAVAFFEREGKGRLLTSIGPDDVKAWGQHLLKSMAGGAARHHINSFSNLYRYAKRDGLVTENPVALLLPKEKPHARPREADWLDVTEAARLLDAAQRYEPAREDMGMPFARPLIATLLLTGGRPSEVLGLEVDDIDLQRKTVTFRVQEARELKNAKSVRVIKLWPQLEAILRDWFKEREQLAGGSDLVFPSFRTGKAKMLTDFRKLLRKVAKLADPPIQTRRGGKLTPKIFRHTYCTTRCQTLEHGVLIDRAKVAKELGHAGTAMVRRVYDHLGTFKPLRVMEYRIPKAKATARQRHANG